MQTPWIIWLITAFVATDNAHGAFSCCNLFICPVLTMAWIITFQARNYKTIQQILYRMNRMCVQAGFGGSLKPRKHEQRLLRNMGVHKVRASLLHSHTIPALPDKWIAINFPRHSHNYNINLNHVTPGGPGPAANSLWCQRRRENERVDEARPSVSAEFLSR